MLQSIHDHATGWVASFILFLLIFAFAIWGIDFQFGGSNYLVKVNGEEVDANRVTRLYQNQLARYQEAFTDGIPPAQLEELKRNVLRASARDEIVYQYSKDEGLRVSDDELAKFIAEQPQFQVGDAFNYDQFSIVAQQVGYTAAGYEEFIRRALVGQQLASAVTRTAFVTEAERQKRGAMEQEKRVVSYYTIPASAYVAEVEPSEEAIVAEYESELDKYRTPEAVKLDYILLDPKALAADVEIDEALLREQYDRGVEGGIYATEEQRRGSHILISNADDDAAAKELAEKVYARATAGEDFAALASEFSDDPGSKSKGGDLGFAPKVAYVGPFGDAMFDMAIDEIRGPVKTTFGYHIIKLAEIQPGDVRSYEDVRVELLEQEQLRLATAQADEISRELDEAVYDNDDSLQAAADQTGMAILQSDWITRASGGGIGSNATVREAAYSDGVLLDRRNSQAIRYEDGYVYLRIAEHRKSEQRPLADARASIVNQIKRRMAKDQAQLVGYAARDKAAAGTPLADLAAEVERDVTASQTLTRRGAALPPAATRAIFAAPAPQGDTPTIGGASVANGDYVVFAVESSEVGETVDKALAERLAQSTGSAQARAYVDELLDAADVELRPEALP